ncbi:hypothetical protein ACEQ8H_002083 [Pleosporales sp. CAS-2024a]
MSPNLRAVALVALATFSAAASYKPSTHDTRQQGRECIPESPGLGPRPTNDTAAGFLDYPEFSQSALSAQTPDGYVRAYVDQHATYDDSKLFVAYKELSSYDVQSCAKLCDATSACNAFTIFYERNPTVTPGRDCPDPSSTTRTKCSLYSGSITAKKPMNKGQYLSKFHVVMAGANAYVKEVYFDASPNIMGYKTDTYNHGGAIQAPLDCYGNNTYLGFKRFEDGKFDASRCTAACDGTDKCRFVNAYLVRDGGVPLAQHCSLYSVHWPAWYATNQGQYLYDKALGINSTKSFGFTVTPGSFDACEPPQKRPVD